MGRHVAPTELEVEATFNAVQIDLGVNASRIRIKPTTSIETSDEIYAYPRRTKAIKY